MHKVFLAAVLSVLIFGTSACSKIKGEGPVVTEQRFPAPFSSIHSGFSGEIFYTPDSVYHISVNGQQNILDVLNTSVSGGTLNIDFDLNRLIGRHDRIQVYVYGPGVTSLAVSGSGDLKVLAPYSPANLNLSISGSGSISIPELYTGKISTGISGSGDITVLNGTATDISTEINGSGTTDLIGVTAKGAHTHTSGSGDTYVQVSDYLDARISGSGDVYYRGRPVITTSISGSGRVSVK